MSPRRLLTAAVAAVLCPLAAGCGSDEPSGPVTQADLEALPGVLEAAAGEFEASDGEERQTIALASMEEDATLEEVTTALETVEGADVDFWAVYLDADSIDPEYPDDDGASGFSSDDVEGLRDPSAAVPVVLAARAAARETQPDARARVAWEDDELELTVVLPTGGAPDVAAVAEDLGAVDELADAPLTVSAEGHEPFPGRPLSTLVAAGSLTGSDGIDDELVSRWDELLAATDRPGDDVEPTSLSLTEGDDDTSASVRLHFYEESPGRPRSVPPRRPEDRLYVLDGDPADVTTAVWGDRLWPVVDGVLAVGDDGSTAGWDVRISDARDPVDPLVELEDDAPRPPVDERGLTWNREAWQRIR